MPPASRSVDRDGRPLFPNSDLLDRTTGLVSASRTPFPDLNLCVIRPGEPLSDSGSRQEVAIFCLKKKMIGLLTVLLSFRRSSRRESEPETRVPPA